MKKLMYFVPVLLTLGFSFLGSRLFASGSIQPKTMVILMAATSGGNSGDNG